MPKKKIAYIGIGILIVLLIFGYIFLFNRLTKNDVEISNYEFLVVADSYDNTGLDLDSGFIITANEDYSLSDVKSVVKVSPEFEYDVKKYGYGTYYLKPDDNLQSGSIYNIYVQDDENMPINSWAFQTKSEFKILSTLPANNEICTNLDTGIQLEFTKKVEKIDNYFEILPNIEGKFSYMGKSVTFIPNEKLTDGEEYTIKVKAGLQAFDGDKLEKDYEFSFKAEEYYYFSQRIVLRDSKVNFTTKDSQVIAFKYGENDFKDKTFIVNIYDLLSYDKYLEFVKNDREIEISDYEPIRSFTSELVYETSGSDHNAFIYYPENLPVGWYLVDITMSEGSKHLQQLVQVSDIVAYMQSLNGQALIWCNDVETCLSLDNIDIKVGEKSFKTNENGVAIFEVTGQNNVVITSNDGKCFVDYINFDTDWKDVDYNIYLYTDRESYLPTDTINYWGMIVPQTSNVKLPKTVELYLEDVLIASDVSVNSSGIFTGNFDITNHLSVYTGINLKINDEIFYGTDILIQEYIKPTYILDFSFDKEYYRINDMANIDVSGNYFDGNPASLLQLNLNIENDTESIELDKMGQESIQYSVNNINRNVWYPAYIYANLQTSGADEYAGKGKSFIYFPTDYSLQTEVIDNEIIIKSNLIDFNKVDVENINTDEIVGDPQSDVYGEVNIYRTDYIKRQVGTYYDFINKINKPQYEYKTNRVLVDTIEFITDINGIARIETNYEVFDDSYYSYEVNYVMPDGFTGKESGTIKEVNNVQNNTYYYFDTGYKNLDVNEEILIKISGSNGFENNGRVIYSVLNEKLQEVALTKNTEFTLKFNEEYIPNVLLTGAYFDGVNIYRINQNYLYYNYEQKSLDITITTDKEQYEPGETVKVNVETKDVYGKTDKTNIVISVVDEAAFAVNEQYEYPLYRLHEFEYYYPMTYFSSNTYDNDLGVGGGGGGDSADYREFFKDNAAFLTIKTGSNGKTSASFTLPDNITSWRITAVGITDSLKAGVATTNAISTLPFYTNIVMNKKYNINDDITFNLKSAGADLYLLSNSIQYTVNLIRNDEIVNSEVKYQLPFKSVNVNLGKVSIPGDYKVEVKSECGVYSDTFIKDFTVENSLHEINIIKDVDLSSKLDINAVKYPVTFMLYDVENKQYYDAIEKVLKTSVGYTSDQKIAYNLVAKKLNELNEDNYIREIEVSQLQKYDGGVGLLNYGSSDVLLTAKICAIMPEYIDTFEAEKYFENVLKNKESVTSEISAAYFGLATLKKPVLNDIRYMLENNSNLSIQDKLNLIAGLGYIGDYEGANSWYEKLIQSRLRENGSYSYIYSYDEYECYSTTSFLTMVLAKINHQDFDKIVRYIIDNDSDVYTPALDLTEYIKAYNPKTESTGFIRYVDDEKEHIVNFAGINNLTLKFDERELKKFEILEVSNVIGKVIYLGTIDEAINLYDNSIEVTKDISAGNEVGNLRTVTIKIKLPANTNKNDYFVINDVVPNGMRFVGSEEYYNYSKDAQKVQFQISNDKHKFEYVIQYNIRNVLQGEYALESAVVLNPKTMEMGYSEEDTIEINE